MASNKRRRKAAKQARQRQRPQTGPFVHPDGDRRHRGGGDAAREAYKNKAILRTIGAVPPADDSEE
jgi:hypothetical protein